MAETTGWALIARCPEHGLHGDRDSCFVCGGPVEQVPMVAASRAEVGMLIDGVAVTITHIRQSVDSRAALLADPDYQLAAPLLRRLQDAHKAMSDDRDERGRYSRRVVMTEGG